MTRAEPMTAQQARGKYQKGTRFEYQIRDKLQACGYAVARGAGSKGSSKADLVAFSPHGSILLIQAKTDGNIKLAEWDRVYEVAMYSARLTMVSTPTGDQPIMVQPVVPIVAFKDERGRLLMDELTDYRIKGKPQLNRRRYEWRCLCDPPHVDLGKLDRSLSLSKK